MPGHRAFIFINSSPPQIVKTSAFFLVVSGVCQTPLKKFPNVPSEYYSGQEAVAISSDTIFFSMSVVPDVIRRSLSSISWRLYRRPSISPLAVYLPPVPLLGCLPAVPSVPCAEYLLRVPPPHGIHPPILAASPPHGFHPASLPPAWLPPRMAGRGHEIT